MKSCECGEELTSEEIHIGSSHRINPICYLCAYELWQRVTEDMCEETREELPPPNVQSYGREKEEVLKKLHQRSSKKSILSSKKETNGGELLLPMEVKRKTSDGRVVEDQNGLEWKPEERELWVESHGWDPGIHPTKPRKVTVRGDIPGNYLEFSVTYPMDSEEEQFIQKSLNGFWKELLRILAFRRIDNSVLRALKSNEEL